MVGMPPEKTYSNKGSRRGGRKRSLEGGVQEIVRNLEKGKTYRVKADVILLFRVEGEKGK